MPIRSLAEVSARLEEAAKQTTLEIETPVDLYEFYEMMAIQILDSNFDFFPEGVLEEHLRKFLQKKAIILLGHVP